MDLAYDHIQEEALSPDDEASSPTGENKERKPEAAASMSSLNSDFQEAYKAISSSPWGARLGGFFGSVVKQGESVYKEATQELTAVSEEASKGISDLRSSILSRTRGLSLTQNSSATASPTVTGAEDKTTISDGTPDAAATEKAIQESESVLDRLRTEASKRIKEIQKAEDAADEALLKFGTNIRNFLRDAVSIAPPMEGTAGQGGTTVLFESKDATGKRVIHTTRFDAQLHVIHTSLESFSKDPISDEYAPWVEKFNVESKTGDISKDLEKYEELRQAMEKLVPDKVKYEDFWKRYYFLRHSVETAEARRRDLLKGAAANEEEEVGWDEDSDDEASKPEIKPKTAPARPSSAGSSTTIHPSPAEQALLKPLEARKSNDEKSQVDSDASYDVVGASSGVPSRAPGSPREVRKGDESEEEDWE